MDREQTNDAEAVALHALTWAIAEPARAERLLALTGLVPADLRERIGDPSMYAAVLRFLEAHEPDLLACAKAIGRSPAHLVASRRHLER